MLKVLRKRKTAKKVWIILCFIIVPPFVLWGFGSAFRTKGEPAYAGRVFNKTISFLEYQNAIEATKNQAIMQFGDKFYEIQKSLNMDSQAWERIILLIEAKKRKIRVSDREVIEQIKKYPFFERQGQFDDKIYQQMLRYVFRSQPRDFEEQTRQNLILAKLYKEVAKDITLKDAETKEEYRKANEEISISYLASLPTDFQKDINPSEKEIKDYFTKNSIQFKQPVSFNLEYIAFEQEDKAKEAVNRLDKKIDIAKVAKETGTIAKETGLFSYLDPIPGIGWSPEIFGILSKAKVNQVLPLIHIDKNYYALKIKEIKEAYIPELDKVKDKVKDFLIKDATKKIAQTKINEALQKIKSGIKDFNKIAKELGIKTDSTISFKYGSYIEGIGASDNFWLAADKLQENEISDIIQNTSGFYIIKLKTHAKIEDKKFEAEKKDFSDKLLVQKQQEFFMKFIQDLKRKAGLI